MQNDRLFREGDKVMQIQNNYKLAWSDDAGNVGEGVFNGDIGIITEIADGRTTVRFTDEKEASYDREALMQLTLAYAVTVHKSQGSEFPAVVLALSGGRSPFLNRRLLYTAVTRAKKKLMIIATSQTRTCYQCISMMQHLHVSKPKCLSCQSHVATALCRNTRYLNTIAVS